MFGKAKGYLNIVMVCLYSRQLRRGFSFILGLGTAVGLGLSTPSPASAIPWGDIFRQGIELIQLSNLSTQQKVQLGQDIHQQLLDRYRLNSDPRTNAYVNRIGQRLAKVSDCSQIPFHFYVVQDPSINAFSTTGGFVYVNTGLLNAVDNEAQLAGVLGHEIGHICNDDLINHIKASEFTQGLASIAGVDRNLLVNLGVRYALELPHSRQDEFNADAKGLQYLERASYDPRAMIAFLTKLLNQPSPPTFLSDHPATSDRIAVLQDKIASSQ